MEEWRNIEGYQYIVSNFGHVRRLGSDKDHSVRDCRGCLVTDLYNEGRRKTVRVHRLVAKAFIDNHDNKPEVNHKDGNRHNNNVDNLEWVTKQENCIHAWKAGLSKQSYGMLGKKNPNGGRKSKPFKIVETGEIFDRLIDCEKAIHGNNRHISECLNGKQQTHRGYHFEYI